MPEELGTLRVKVDADISAFKSGMEQVKQGTTSAADSMDKMATSFTSAIQQNKTALTTLGIALTGVGAVLTGFGASATKTFQDFDSAMRNVQSVMQGSEEDFKVLSEYAIKLGKDTSFSAKEAANALYYMASAGFSVEEQMQATSAVLNLAAATQSDLASAAELVATTLTSFALPATKATSVTDTLAKAIGKSQATFEKLAYSLPYVATQANQLGYSLEDTVAALALLYDGGLKGEMAGTRLREVFNTLLDPTQKEAEAIKALGIRIEDVNPATNSLVDIVRQFEKAGLTAADAAKIFGARAEGMTILVSQGSEKLERMTNELKNSAGAAEQMAKIQLAGLGGALEQLSGSIETLKIKFGESLAPALIKIMKTFEQLFDAISALPAPILNIGAHLATLGGAFTALAGASLLFISRIPDMLAGMQAVKVLIISLTSAMSPLAVAIGAGSAIIASITAALWAYSNAQKQAKEDIEKSSPTIIEFQERVRTLEQVQKNLNEAIASGADKVSLYQLGLAKVPTPLIDIKSAQQIVNQQLSEAQQKLALVDKGYAGVISQTKLATGAKGDLQQQAKNLQSGLVNLKGSLDSTEAGMKENNTVSQQLQQAYENLKQGTTDLSKSMADLSSKIEQSRVIAKSYADESSALKAAQEQFGEYFTFIQEGESGVTLYIDQEHKKRINSEIELGKTSILNLSATLEEGKVVRDKSWEELKEEAKKLNEDLLKADLEGIRSRTEALANFATFEGTTYEQRKQEIIDTYNLLLDKYIGDTEARKSITEELNARLRELDASAYQDAVDQANAKLDLEVSISAASIALAEKEAEEIGKTRKTMFEEDVERATEYVNKLKEQSEKRWDSEEKAIKNFMATELGLYSAQKEKIIEKYNEMLALYEKHGYDTLELEKWKNEEILKLTTSRINNEISEAQSFLQSLSRLYQLFNNAKDEDEQNWFVKSISRLYQFLETTKQVIKDAINIWTTFGKVIDIINKLGIGSENAGLVGSLFSAGKQASQTGAAGVSSMSAIGASASSATASISTLGSSLAGLIGPLAAVATLAVMTGKAIGESKFAQEHETAAGFISQIVGGFLGTLGFQWGKKSRTAQEEIEKKWEEESQARRQVLVEEQNRLRELGKEIQGTIERTLPTRTGRSDRSATRGKIPSDASATTLPAQHATSAWTKLEQQWLQEIINPATPFSDRYAYGEISRSQKIWESRIEQPSQRKANISTFEIITSSQPSININAGTIIASQQSIDEFARLIFRSARNQGLT